MAKVLLIVNTDGALYVFRKPIITKLLSLGHEVVSISSKSDYFNRLEALGVTPIALEFARHSISPLQNIRLFVRLFRMIRRYRPDIVHNFTHKPAIYGTIAAWLAGVPKVFVTITGLGTLFVRDDVSARIMRWLLLLQYKLALRCAAVVFFQNPDDMSLFLSKRLLPTGKALLTFGSALDLSEFPCPSPSDVTSTRLSLGEELGADLTQRRVVLFPARGVREKGFFEFYEAARIVNESQPNRYTFLHLGSLDPASSGRISKEGIERFANECGVRYLGFRDNIRHYMTACDIVVLPSFREGTPRSLIEALALGKALVTTDAPGCRETVIDGWNGYLCRIGDARSLAEKILAVDEDLIASAVTRSRSYCERKYDANWLVELTIDCYMGNAR